MNTQLSKLQSNAKDITSVSHAGVEWLVVPGVPLQEQVMKNYLVERDEIQRSMLGWNGIPLSLNHPRLNGGSVNVPDPDVAVIGKFYNANWDNERGRMVGEYWIDVKTAERFAEGVQIIDTIRNGGVVETSTGYYSDDIPTSGEFRGRHYDIIHKNLLPDHIAILPAGIQGACSVKDGCGVNRNMQEGQCGEMNFNCDVCPMAKNNKPPAYKDSHLPTALLLPFSFNKGSRTQEQLDNAKAKIQKNGITTPVSVTVLDDGLIKIEDGNHRVAIANEIGIEQIPVKVFNENMDPVDSRVVYDRWLHKEDQGYLKSNGGKGSGNFGHSGLPGEHGGSRSKGAGGGSTSKKSPFADKSQGSTDPEIAAVESIIRSGDYSRNERKQASKDRTAILEAKKRTYKDGQTYAKFIDGLVSKGAKLKGKGASSYLVLGDEKYRLKTSPEIDYADYKTKRAKTNSRQLQDDSRRRTVLRKIMSNTKKEIHMTFEELQNLLKSQGMTLSLNEDSEDPDFILKKKDEDEDEEEEEMKKKQAAKNSAGSLSPEELSNLRSLAAIAPALVSNSANLEKLEVVANYADEIESRHEDEKKTIIGRIKVNSANIFTDEELAGMALPVLRKQEAQMNANYAPAGLGASRLFQNSGVALTPPSPLSTYKQEAK
jgi:hypothetical protein